MSPLSMINSPLGRGVNDFEKKELKIFKLYMRGSESKANFFPKRYLEIDEVTVVRAAIDTEIRL